MPHRRKYLFEDDDQTISANFDQISEDCARGVSRYLEIAIKSIDDQFEEGYAEDNPDLVGAFLNACAQSEHAAYTIIASQKIARALRRVTDEIDEIAEKDDS
jgi:hypothetical protein